MQTTATRAVAWAGLALSLPASAIDIDIGDPDWSVRWDNTPKLSAKYRLHDADPALKDSFRLLVPGVPASAFPQALNQNAGDQNFQKKGWVSERVDLLSEFDAVFRKNFGVRVSGAAWYDAELHRQTQADNDPTLAQTPPNEFPEQTRRRAGGTGELLDAFVFGGWQLDGGGKITTRLGRHALQYGESLFFGDNGIAAANGPVDIDKLLASPNAQFKEIIRPVAQWSAQWQLANGVAIGGYYQFRWESLRLPYSGSYFSTSNTPWGSQQPVFVGIPAGPLAGNYVAPQGTDRKASDAAQYGMQVKWRIAETDFGLYAARYHDKAGQLYTDLNPITPAASRFYFVFPEGVKVFGASASRTLGEANLAAEISMRSNMPLRSRNMVYPSALGAPEPRYARGRTLHGNFSWFATLGPNLLANETLFIGELAFNRVLSYDDPDQVLDQGVTRSASALRFVFSPTWRQVIPGLDLSAPLGVGYNISGHSSVTAWGAKKTGDVSLGVDGTYLGVWQFGLGYTHYIGKAVPFVDFSPLASGDPSRHEIYGLGNALADRDHITLSVRRTF